MNKLAPILHSQQYAYKASPAQIIGYVLHIFFFCISTYFKFVCTKFSLQCIITDSNIRTCV